MRRLDTSGPQKKKNGKAANDICGPSWALPKSQKELWDWCSKGLNVGWLSWQKNHLFIGGMIPLIKVMLTNLFVFHMSLLRC